MIKCKICQKEIKQDQECIQRREGYMLDKESGFEATEDIDYEHVKCDKQDIIDLFEDKEGLLWELIKNMMNSNQN